MSKSDKPVTAIIVGAGHRSLGYASYALKYPEKLNIIGVVEPNQLRREKTAKTHNINKENCFKSIDELVDLGKPIADTVINGTMDKIHVKTSIPLLKSGYDMLLEKPISTNEKDLLKLLKVSKNHNRKVMICHVLRFAPFYAEIKKRIINGDIGEIINIQTNEHVSYDHMSVAYVRGKWNNESKSGSSMLMAKCSHDLDIITWMKSGKTPKLVNSFGSLMQFKPEKMPQNAGDRCLVNCPIEENCLYSAKKLYIDHPERWSFYVWSYIEDIDNPTIEDKINSLKKDNPHGRCIWKCDNNVVDHQSVIIQFEDGSTATHNMVGGSAKGGRNIHIIGTKGEIKGNMQDNEIVITYPDPRPDKDFEEEMVKINFDEKDYGDNHGGGDERLVEDFVNVINGNKTSISTTNLDDSIYGHLIGFKADQAMHEKKVKEIKF